LFTIEHFRRLIVLRPSLRGIKRLAGKVGGGSGRNCRIYGL